MPSLICQDACAETPAIKGSRFIGDARVVRTEAEARAVWAAVRKQHHKARHHCIAWRLADGGFGRSDDGEPSGTGGPPILQRLEGGDLVDVVVVVVRYYGGTKLGRGGLVRAYGDAAAAALEAAGTRPLIVHRQVVFACSYGRWGAVQNLLGDAPHTTEFGAEVLVSLDAPVAQVDQIVDALAERWGIGILPGA